MNILPTYERCVEICQSAGNDKFYESKFFIDGFEISIFNYRYVTYQDFLDNSSFELRGLTFVFNLDGTLYKTFPLFEKFFNLNENDACLYEDLKNLKVKSVQSKLDGSIINFVELPNGKIIAKSKTSFESEQARMAQKLFNTDSKLNTYITQSIQMGLTPIFELVSPKNRIVVNYNKTKLILLGLRNCETGLYGSLDNVLIEKADSYKFSLNDLLSLKSNLEGIEGWVVEFQNGQKVKIKTNWYLDLHKIMTDYSNREDYLIDFILDEKIDDILSQLEIGSEMRSFVEKVQKVTLQKISELKSNIVDLQQKWNGDKKEFAFHYKNELIFPLTIKVIEGHNLDDVVKTYIKKVTYRLSSARVWLGL